MTVRFIYNSEFGLQVEAEDGEELTQEQAMIVAVRDLAASGGSLAHALWEISQTFEYKKFYDEDARERLVPRGVELGAKLRGKKGRCAS